MRWIAIDPGNKVGWANGTVTYRPTVGYVQETDCLPTPEEIQATKRPELRVEGFGITPSKVFQLTLLKRATTYDYIIFENYHIDAKHLRAHLGSDVPTIQVIGGIKLAAWAAQAERGDGFPHLVDQWPRAMATGRGCAKLYLPASLVEEMADAREGKHDDGHHESALAHAAAWFHTDVARR